MAFLPSPFNRRGCARFPNQCCLRSVRLMLQRDVSCCIAQNAKLLCNINTLNRYVPELDMGHRICRAYLLPGFRRIGQRLPPPRRWPQIRHPPDLLPRRVLFFQLPHIDVSFAARNACRWTMPGQIAGQHVRRDQRCGAEVADQAIAIAKRLPAKAVEKRNNAPRPTMRIRAQTAWSG